MAILAKYVDVYPNNNFEKIHEESFVWHNFLSQDELNEIMDQIKIAEDQSVLIKENAEFLLKYQSRLESSLIGDGWRYFKPLNRFHSRRNNNYMPFHIDLPNTAHKQIYAIEKSNNTGNTRITLPTFALIIYFNDNYDGGELCYPEHDIVYKPKAGDLVIHYAETIHGTSPVKNGTKYTHSTSMDTEYFIDINNVDEESYVKSANGVDGYDDYSQIYLKSENKRVQEFQSKYPTHFTFSNGLVFPIQYTENFL